ncbi:hypothetical protein GCM10010195_34160 [Kitasatospora griseola]|nr:hypothetical protein GCM10010195_34160 [Kitasatospora griseola]
MRPSSVGAVSGAVDMGVRLRERQGWGGCGGGGTPDAGPGGETRGPTAELSGRQERRVARIQPPERQRHGPSRAPGRRGQRDMSGVLVPAWCAASAVVMVGRLAVNL